MHGWNGAGHMGWMSIWWIVGAALIAVAIWAFLRSSRGPMGRSSEQVLKGRYAKGEIDHATYQRMLTELKG